MLTVAGGVLATLATDLILMGAGAVGGPGQVPLMTCRDGTTVLTATGLAGWCESYGFPIEAVGDQTASGDLSPDDGLEFIRGLEELGDAPSEPAVSMSRLEFAEALAQARTQYNAVFTTTRPLQLEQVHELTKAAKVLFLGTRMIGPEITQGLLGEPPDIDGGRVMHFALILGASMQLIASNETITDRDDAALLRETNEQSELIDDWIARALGTHQAS
jgi:hypothetical protein